MCSVDVCNVGAESFDGLRLRNLRARRLHNNIYLYMPYVYVYISSPNGCADC